MTPPQARRRGSTGVHSCTREAEQDHNRTAAGTGTALVSFEGSSYGAYYSVFACSSPVMLERQLSIVDPPPARGEKLQSVLETFRVFSTVRHGEGHRFRGKSITRRRGQGAALRFRSTAQRTYIHTAHAT